MKPFFLYTSMLILVSCGEADKKDTLAEAPQAPLAQGMHSDAFNQSFNRLLADYYSLKDNFIAEKSELILQSSQQMTSAVDSLQLQELKADSSIIATAKSYADGISADLKGLAGEKDMEEQRKAFQLVSEQLYDLVRTVQYDRAIVYHQYCPMAFNDQGAYWLSNSPGIRNPYLPKKMPTCGEVKDSVDFRPKQ